MEHDIRACLKDIEQAIQEIYEFLPKIENFIKRRKSFPYEKQLTKTMIKWKAMA